MKALNILLLLLLIFANTTAQNKNDKAFSEIEATYETGDYSKALEDLEKFKSKNLKKLGESNEYSVRYYLLTAQIKLASGEFSEFESNLEKAKAFSIQINKVNSVKHGEFLIKAAELYTQNGSFRIARNYLNDAKTNLEKGKFFKDNIKAQWEVIQAETLTGQGYYTESLQLLKGNLTYFARRAVKEEAYQDDKGNLKTRKVPPADLTIRYKN